MNWIALEQFPSGSLLQLQSGCERDDAIAAIAAMAATFTRCVALPSVVVASPATPSLQQQIPATRFSSGGAVRGRGDVKLRNEPLLRDDEGREESEEDGEQSWSRRGVMGAAALALASSSVYWSCEPAQAFELGICKVDFCLLVDWYVCC